MCHTLVNFTHSLVAGVYKVCVTGEGSSRMRDVVVELSMIPQVKSSLVARERIEPWIASTVSLYNITCVVFTSNWIGKATWC